MKSLLFTIFLFITCSLSAQRYKEYYRFGVGLRAGVKSGLTLKLFATDHLAFEAIVGYWHKSIDATLLAERHFYPFRIESLSWYCGGGGHITGDAAHDNWETQNGVEYKDGQTAYGADLIAGLEFKFPVIPVAISIDLKPFIEFSSVGGYITAFDGGLGIKLAF